MQSSCYNEIIVLYQAYVVLNSVHTSARKDDVTLLYLSIMI
jgi:hypothetical protein